MKAEALFTAYWRLDEADAKTPAYNAGSLQGLDGSYRNTDQIKLQQSGALKQGGDWAAQFDVGKTASYVEVPWDMRLNSADFSVEAWVKFDPNHMPPSSASQPAAMTIVSSYEETKEGYELFLLRLPASWEVWGRVWPAGNGAAGASNIARFDLGMPSGWTHLVLTFASATKTLKIWVDGDERDSKKGVDYTALGTTVKRPLRIGARGQDKGTEEYGFKGSIDEVAIYAGTLGLAQIQNHHQIGIT